MTDDRIRAKGSDFFPALGLEPPGARPLRKDHCCGVAGCEGIASWGFRPPASRVDWTWFCFEHRDQGEACLR